ncbi:MAG: hypothetical protein NTY07_17105 [Bacteroidia bacterium]|nr:hypothetical protein [Bacteroidia bacterium]
MKNQSVLMTIAVLIIAMSLAAQETGTFKDKRDGKTYKTVKIGTQTWMAENLAYKAEDGYYCPYDRDKSNLATYGYLYDWYTAKNSCPSGWHLPEFAEWATLIDYLGGENVAAGKLKAKSTWKKPDENPTNSSGFTALPGGFLYLDEDGKVSFDAIGIEGYWWSSTAAYAAKQFKYLKLGKINTVFTSDFQMDIGLSVRCVKDK